MDATTIWGIILLVYAAFVILITVIKPAPIWRMGKVQAFVKLLGEKGTVIFFWVFALIAAGIGIALLL